MRNLLALFALVLLVFVGVGWFRDWYDVKTTSADAGHHSVNIDINRAKIISDVEKGIQKLEEKKQQYSDSADTTTADQGPDLPASTKPGTEQAASKTDRP